MSNGINLSVGSQEPFVSNCFPVRQSMRIRNIQGAGGAWMVVYRNQQKKELKAILCSKAKTFDDIKRQREIAESQGVQVKDVRVVKQPDSFSMGTDGKTLSSNWILRHLKIEKFTDVALLRIESNDLQTYNDENFEQFENVVEIRASDNVLPIETFLKFPALEVLDMQMNGIGDRSSVVTGLLSDTTQFDSIYPRLRQLNLNYNELTGIDFDSLSYLPQLQELSLVGNSIGDLPAPDYQRMEANLFFPNLLFLDLSENLACKESDFLYLCGFPKLQMLNMSSNGIKSIPSIHFTGHRYAIVYANPNDSPKGDDGADDTARLSTIAETTSERSTPAMLLLPPFPELMMIDLSHNMISTDIGLSGVVVWPSLRQVILDGNPIIKKEDKQRRKQQRAATSRFAKSQSNESPNDSICHFLEESLGVSVVRKKEENEEPQKEKLKTTSADISKRYPSLKAKVPKVPRCDVEKLLSLCPPPTFETIEQKKSDVPMETEVTQNETDAQIDNGNSDTQEPNIQFFMTELADIDNDKMKEECTKSLGLEENEKTHGGDEKAIVIYDPKFKGFEELFTEDDPIKDLNWEDELPTTLQASVHSLRRLLDLPSTTRRPEAAIEAWAKRQMELRRKVSGSTLQTLSAVGRISERRPNRYEPHVSGHPDLGPREMRTYQQRVDKVLTSQRNQSSVSDAPLQKVLESGPGSDPRMYKSAHRLLGKITKQYDSLRSKIDEPKTD